MDIVTVGVIALVLAVLALGAAMVGFGFEVYDRVLDWRERRALGLEVVVAHEEAIAIDGIIEDLKALDRKVHYRHNIHCPQCGRFARQAVDWPAGVSDCKVHGIKLRTIEAPTGPIAILFQEVVLDELEIARAPETPELAVAGPTPLPDDLTLLEEHGELFIPRDWR